MTVKSESVDSARGDAVILVVEDEEDIRSLVGAMLINLGYRVQLAGNGSEAVEYYRNNWEEIDLVLLDIIMPGMSGLETFQNLQSINADVKVLLVSGYSADGKAAEMLDAGAVGFVQKPFDIPKLSAILQSALQQ